ncbi:fibrobacter succinogenes major paralogous domain-containing protein [Croceimicrobium hydrocarbonivorans]|uniref:Fibrobacter succinogenes major paralogous domain-containing protein n=1 Tax=Croceimicrobium hydrocarbonivorans TaxID=2761580 RepID=A0A7H0VJ92_9FLAO|nr:fibrobacter succinogenes major paralogous domain-containing protein [Croceimicrobium hydrocarbonivorans]QNR25790.1 fibrobacter succinogenes major paralogous domain-containing protein [Croceimicrobium hydrocarbonivorans]
MKRYYILLLASLLIIAAKEGEESMTDHDGNTYHTTIVANYEVMAENYAVTKFRNGDPIYEAKSEEDWHSAAREGRPAYCKIEGPTGQEAASGYLYNWFVVRDPRGFAPEGWKVPSKAEFTEMLKEGDVHKSKSWAYGYRVLKESRKKVEKMIRKEEVNPNYPVYRLMFHASGMRGGFGKYKPILATKAYVMLEEYDKVYSIDSHAEEVDMDAWQGGFGVPVRLIRKLK